jgi:hypothetical protein
MGSKVGVLFDWGFKDVLSGIANAAQQGIVDWLIDVIFLL